MTEIRILGPLGGICGEGTTLGIDWQIAPRVVTMRGVKVSEMQVAVADLLGPELDCLRRLGGDMMRVIVEDDEPWHADAILDAEPVGFLVRARLSLLPRTVVEPCEPLNIMDFA